MDNTASSQHRNMDQRDQTRPRPTTTKPSNEREKDATNIELHAGPFCKGVKSRRADIEDLSQITS
jgi:hypothetical protein